MVDVRWGSLPVLLSFLKRTGLNDELQGKLEFAANSHTAVNMSVVYAQHAWHPSCAECRLDGPPVLLQE